MSGWADPQKGGRAVGAALYPTLSSLLSTAPQPGMRATASDAPGSMLYEVGGKWGGSLGRISFTNLSALPVAYIAPGTTADVTADGYSVMSHELRGGRWLPIRPVDKRLFDDFPTAICWVTRASAADNNWCAVTYIPSRDRLVAVAFSGTGNRVMTSDDGGVTWVTRASAADNNWRDVIYIPSRDRIVAVADSLSGTGNRVMTSGGFA